MPEYYEILILFGVGVLAGLINIMAGGGSSFTLPALIFLGLDSPTANGTNRVGILIQSIFATISFRNENITGLRLSLRLGALTIPGAILGALLAVRVSDRLFEIVLGIIMIGIVITMLVPQSKDIVTTPEGKKSWLIYPIMFGVGFYGGFLQVGVGFLIMAGLYHLMKMNLVYVNMHKAFINLIFTIPALAIFMWTNNVDWVLGLVLAVGNALGGWWSAKISVRGGEKVIRYVMVVAIIIIALKLFGLF
ncbi:MAG: sulfite exporter TauE/SafE family protein [Thermodesulfobacteriota bacterium]